MVELSVQGGAFWGGERNVYFSSSRRKILRMAAPDHPPGSSRRGWLINTGPQNSNPRNSSEMLPLYSDLFPRPSPPCNMEPLVEAMWLNQAISNLTRLPDNVLRNLIRNLDNCGVECLRRVSRRFIPLCDEEILARPHTHQPKSKLKDHGGPHAWPRFKVFSGPWNDSAAGERQRLLQLLARDWYCEGCRGARDAPDWDRRVERLTRFLYCHPCKAEHPACLFSAQQRQSTTSRRRCIAHEGYFRLCQHNEGIVRWSEISRIRQRLSEGVEDRGAYKIRCEDISHVVPTAHTGTQKSGETIFLPGCNVYNCIERPSPEIRVDGPRIWLHWTTHLQVERNGRHLTAADLRRRIPEIRERGGRFLCPAITFTEDVPEMRCFDPNDCDCVLLQGQDNVRFQSGSSLKSERVCRLSPSRRLFSSYQSSSLRFASFLVDGVRRLLPTNKLGFRKKCASSEKAHRARLDFHISIGHGRSDVKRWPCHAGDCCLVFEYSRVLVIGPDGAIGAQWYQALDPDSYSLTEDEEGFGIYWCRQKECRNYHVRVPGFSRIVRGAEYHRSVDIYWPSMVI